MSTEHNTSAKISLQEEDPGSLKLIIALGLAGLLGGIVLVASYLYTLPLIEANRTEALQRAIFKVLPDCATYKAHLVKDGQLFELLEETGDQKKKKKKGEESSKIYAGFNVNNELVGFAIPGSEPGFQDIIGAIFGYDATNKVIVGFEVLESKETPGLGDKIFKDVKFQTNFTALAIDPEIKPVKKGAKKNPNEVESITGATISSKAVVRLLNKTIAEWRTPIDDYMNSHNINLSK